MLFVPWPGTITTFPPQGHKLSFGQVKETFASVDIEIVFRNRAKGRSFGLEKDQVQQTPKSHTSIWDHAVQSQDIYILIHII